MVNIEPAKFLPFVRIQEFHSQKTPVDFNSLKIESNYQIFLRQNSIKSNEHEVVAMRICKQEDFDKVGAGDFFKK